MEDLTECEDCGACFPATWEGQCVCPDCERQHALAAAEEQEERLLENALSCTCGAWGISPTTGRVYHAADCVCGRT